MLSCVRLLYVICTLCYVQWLDHVCLLVSTDRICCHVYVCCMWSVHCVTSSDWTMFAYSCLLTVYVVMCYIKWLDHLCLLVSTDRICSHVYVAYMYSVHCVTSSDWTMFAYSCLLTVYVVMCTSAVCNLYTVLRPVIGPCLLTRVCWPYMLSCVHLLYVICTLCSVQWL